MDITPVSPSSLPPLSSALTSQTSIGTNIANETTAPATASRPTATPYTQTATSTPTAALPREQRVNEPAAVAPVPDSHAVEQQRQQQREALEKVVARIEEFVGSTLNKGLAFRIDEESGKNTVTIYDKRTGDVVRQIPDEDMLAVSRQLVNHSGGLVTTKV
ncbi:flagellin protein FlaG [Photobacterium aphoticum]|uniref:Flagellin protein FlaG n=1 Tax=Photobacterium aphoticum TaxID=754436 RepID=A0A090RH62_9GAMM|nr:flagellin protein FlaG [Photobacterium aphoticum]